MIKTLFCTLGTSLLFAATPAFSAEERPVNIVAPFEITGLDPAKTGDLFQRMRIGETLVGTDATGKPVPTLATGWTTSADGKVWTFTLRQNVRFHDGSVMTAEAVAASLNIARAKPGTLGKAPVEAIAADGTDTLRITLSRPFAPLVAFLADARSQVLAPASYEGTEVKTLIGTGPFRLTKIEVPQSLSVEQFADYWGTKPQMQAARYLAVGRAETRALMAESGDGDYVYNLDPASRTRLAKSDKVKLEAVSIRRSVLIKVNAGHPLLKDVKLREALSLAIDREGLAKAVLRYPAAATQLFPPTLGIWNDPSLAPLAYDPEKAESLLTGLGWKKGADGVMQKDGQRLVFTLTTYPDRPELPLLATVLQEQWKQIGVDVQISLMSSSEIPARHNNGTLELGLMARNFAEVPDPIGTMLQDYGPKGGDWGAMNWTNPEFQQALETLVNTTDPTQAEALRHKLVSVIQSDLPVIPVAWYQQSVAISPKLENAGIDPFERSFGLDTMRWAK
ncbi:ABC transporter substrate-binding protein [Rhizobium sp.]|jgi:peptide/nickel transport system substrate-binding protein|uniref:ABC transporter substrate-binding protein n=1 Tax=Rhizobium sp. TaxID=391 RepID=UPI000E89BCE3|nr:ABC transporter substrate-binding protein [Rhizobium sp.]